MKRMRLSSSIWILSSFTLVAFGMSMLQGAANIPIPAIWNGLWGRGAETDIEIILQLRLPRNLLALVIGAGLGGSGAALQAYSRNPLAAPGILGFSACAALGAVCALYFGAPAFMPIAALISTALGAGLILTLAGIRKSAATLILAGIGVSALATALTGLIMNFAPNPWALSEMAFWLMGSLKNADMQTLGLCAVLTTVGLMLLCLKASDLRTLSLGEETAMSLGISLPHLRLSLIAGVALCVGSGVAVAGTIGFVGLFVPHIIRLTLSADPIRLIPFSAIGGAGFLCLADMITRALSGPGTPLYLGVFTALIGVPFFLYLVVRDTHT